MGIYGISKRHLERYTPGLPYGFDELMLDLIERGTLPPATPSTGLARYRAARRLRPGEQRIRHPRPRLLPGMR